MTSPAKHTERVRLRRGEQIEVEIDSIAQGGAGVARHRGLVVFCQSAFPGDRVVAEITKSKRDYAQAHTVELLEPSKDRVPQRCDHEGDPCPGSPWQELRYEVQIAHKQELVADALRRLGRLDSFELEPIAAAEPIWRYRNKMEYSFGAAGDGDQLALGFHARGRWDQIRNARDCQLASERSNRLRNHIRDWCAREGLTPFDRRDGGGFLRNLVIREGSRTGAVQVRLVTGLGDFRRETFASAITEIESSAGVYWTSMERIGETTFGGTSSHLEGPQLLEEELGGLRFQISPQAFFQTNTRMAETLYSVATEYAQLSGRERVYDLYCGIGTLSLTLALRAGEVWAIDITEQAIADAIENARINEIDNVSFFAGDARLAIAPLAEQAPRPDVVVVDPPRAGLSKKVVRRLLETAPKRIVYVSCNPTTLAPNARQIVDGGYRLTRVRPIDMFPHTPHIECVALLERAVA